MYWNQLHGTERLSACTYTLLPPKPTLYISNDHIMQHFLIAFEDLKDCLLGTMCTLTGKCCSCDDTFKIAKHILIQHRDKWTPQYNLLFIIQNEIGQLIFWQLGMERLTVEEFEGRIAWLLSFTTTNTIPQSPSSQSDQDSISESYVTMSTAYGAIRDGIESVKN